MTLTRECSAKVCPIFGQVPERPSKEEAARSLARSGTHSRPSVRGCADDVPDPEMGLASLTSPNRRARTSSGFLAGAGNRGLPGEPATCARPVGGGSGLLGSRNGEGQLSRCICAIAHGQMPHAVTGGGTTEELEKRIAAELMQGGSPYFSTT